MKFQVGEKVKYDSGDWWFYGTVTAVIENSICPSYRVSVDKMEKKNCRFSITQFEFELGAGHEVESEWENFENVYLKKYAVPQQNEELPKDIKQEPVQIQEPTPKMETKLEPEMKMEQEPEPKQELKQEPELKMEPKQEPELKTEPKQEPELKTETKQEPETVKELSLISELVTTPTELEPEKKQRKKRVPKQELNQENVETPQEPKQETPRRRRGDAWDRNYELYIQGNRSNLIHAWVSQNRKLYKLGELKDEKLEKLIAINFPFEVQQIRKKRT